jgi:hypothetical protein
VREASLGVADDEVEGERDADVSVGRRGRPDEVRGPRGHDDADGKPPRRDLHGVRRRSPGDDEAHDGVPAVDGRLQRRRETLGVGRDQSVAPLHERGHDAGRPDREARLDVRERDLERRASGVHDAQPCEEAPGVAGDAAQRRAGERGDLEARREAPPHHLDQPRPAAASGEGKVERHVVAARGDHEDGLDHTEEARIGRPREAAAGGGAGQCEDHEKGGDTTRRSNGGVRHEDLPEVPAADGITS